MGSVANTAIKNVMRYQLRLVVSLVFLWVLSSCTSSRVATRLLDWDPSLVTGPIRLAFVSSPQELHEISAVDVFSTEQHIQIYARIADTAGNLFRLPQGLRAQWMLMGSDEQDPFFLEGFDETSEGRNALRIVSIRKGFAEGQYLYLIPSRPQGDVSYGLRVTVRLSDRLVLNEFVPIRLRLPRSE